MKKFFKWATIITAGLIALAGGLFAILTFWDRILSFGVAGKQLGSNVVKSFTNEKAEKDDPNDYYDI
jgi:hypothetical protein